MTRTAKDLHTRHASETRALECPVCSTTLTAMTAGGVTVDVCAGGCGGMWFDWFELGRVDERHETGEGLLEVRRDPTLEVDPQKRISCPLDGEIMMRHFRSVRRRTIVDECPRCAGFWLHFGELVSIRQEFDTTEERKAAALEYYSEMFDPDLAVEHARTMSDLEKARKVAHAFRFICPSYYMPGEQDWGAF
jgi:uncharacterized protein